MSSEGVFVMKEIKLDPKKLLGFKAVASLGNAATLRSPKIGVKQEITRLAQQGPTPVA
jgi:hypothetical protein